MADWKKLNKEFDNVLDNLTDKDWEEFNNYVKEKQKNRSSIKTVHIEGNEEISIKRFYIPMPSGIEAKCPNCGAKISFLKDDYLSYPILNEFEVTGACCDECEADLELDVKLSMAITFDTSKVKKI